MAIKFSSKEEPKAPKPAGSKGAAAKAAPGTAASASKPATESDPTDLFRSDAETPGSKKKKK